MTWSPTGGLDMSFKNLRLQGTHPVTAEPPRKQTTSLVDDAVKSRPTVSFRRTYTGALKKEVSLCEHCNGRGHTATSPHLITMDDDWRCTRVLYEADELRRMPLQRSKKIPFQCCGGFNHAWWQCPSLFVPGTSCPQCLGTLQGKEETGEHASFQPFAAKHSWCELCKGI
eukprot:2482992-Amphidinium_carterae.1